MESKRQQKFSKQLQRDLGDIFLKDTKGQFQGMLVSVVGVSVSPDLGVAFVNISFLGQGDKSEAFDKINAMKKDIRLALGKKIGKKVRIVPELVFKLDSGVDYAMEIDSIMRDIDIPEETPLNEDDYNLEDEVDE